MPQWRKPLTGAQIPLAVSALKPRCGGRQRLAMVVVGREAGRRRTSGDPRATPALTPRPIPEMAPVWSSPAAGRFHHGAL